MLTCKLIFQIVSFCRNLDHYHKNASGTCKACIQKPFPNGEHRILKCYNKRIILKVDKSKQAQINLLGIKLGIGF